MPQYLKNFLSSPPSQHNGRDIGEIRKKKRSYALYNEGNPSQLSIPYLTFAFWLIFLWCLEMMHPNDGLQAGLKVIEILLPALYLSDVLIPHDKLFQGI